jgi:predicted metalloprotease
MTDPDRPVERETTVIHTDGGGGGGGAGVLVGVILVIAVLALLFYLFGGQLLGTKKTDLTVKVETPAATK